MASRGSGKDAGGSRGRPAAARLRLAAAILLAGGAALGGGGANARAASLLTLEPGLREGSGRALLPVCLTDSAAAPTPPVTISALRLEAAGREITGAALVSLSPPPAGEGSALALLLHLPPQDAARVDGWSKAALDFARGSAPGAPRAVLVAGQRLHAPMPLGAAPPAPQDVADALATAAPAPLWDRVLDALDLLSAASASAAPARRALLVVATGEEQVASLHPVRTCLDAAAAARVAVYCLALPAPDAAAAGGGAGPARLRQLAEGSGGRLVDAGEPDGGLTPAEELQAWHRLLSLVESAQGVAFAARDLQLPAALSVRLDGEPGVAAQGALRERALVRRRGLGFWPALGLALLAAGTAGGVVLRWRRRSFGELVVRRDDGFAVVRLRGGEVSIGSAPRNTVTVADRRVSREHAVIALRGGKIILTDLRTTNGTCVNGQPVRTATLRDGDVIVLGGAAELVYRRSPPRARKRP